MTAGHTHTTLLTGAAGFLGHYVLRDLLVRGQRVVAMLRPPLAETRNRLLRMTDRIGLSGASYIAGGQLAFAEGWLPEGLPEPRWGRTDSVVHCAASLKLFSNGNGSLFATNVEGIEALIDWAGRHGVTRIHAVSTAYTCGWDTGVIEETFHHPMPCFQTDYEKSKWIAESLLEQWGTRPGHTLTLFRPSFIAGDSGTGYTTQFGGFYQLLRLVSVLKERYRQSDNGESTYIPLRIPGRPGDPAQNVVPVDYASRVIVEVVVRPEFQGRIYHLTNPAPPTNEMMKRCYEDYFGLHGGYFAEPREVLGHCSPAESLLWDQYHLLAERVAGHNPVFNTTNTRELMQTAGLTFPVLTRDRLWRLFDYAARCNFGRGSGRSQD